MTHNWIDGRPCAAQAGATFRGAGASSWPRSTSADLDQALQAVEAARPAWSALPSGARRERLALAAADLTRATDPDPRLEQALGLDAHEAAQLASALAEELAQPGTARPGTTAGPGRPERIGTLVLRLDWTELGAGLARAVFGALAQGQGVVVLSDPLAPFLVEPLLHALAAAELPRGLVAALHDDSGACLEAALHDARVVGTRFSGPPGACRRVERWSAALARGAGPAGARPGSSSRNGSSSRSGAGARSFGAGLEDDGLPRLELAPLRNTSALVTRQAEVGYAAREIARGVFARLPGLSGQRAGGFGRVLCHERVFSRFSAALLAELAALPDAARPLRCLDPGLAEHVRRAHELGLDEGATPIFTAADLPGPLPPGTLAPLVLTNVEEHLRIAWLGRPAPILCLVRVQSDERARELARELDLDPLAEDLSSEAEAVGPGGPAGGPGLPAAPSGTQDLPPDVR